MFFSFESRTACTFPTTAAAVRTVRTAAPVAAIQHYYSITMIRTIETPRYQTAGSHIRIPVIFLFITAIFKVHLSVEEIFSGPVSADGEILVFGGRVPDRTGRPVPDASVEIWQTDGQGIYDHPGDSKTHRRDRAFQFFGTSVSDSSGSYIFRTVIPGQYEPRPRHIHVKIRRSERVLLVSQIYFSVDGETRGVGGSTGNLRMDLETVENSDCSTLHRGSFDFAVYNGIAGGLALTDRQGEGPYYPLYDVSRCDNDLAQVSDN